MTLSQILKSPGTASALTMMLLISSYIFTIIYNSNPDAPSAKIFLFLTMAFLLLFLLGFALLAISFLNVQEIKNSFKEPLQMSIASSLLLVCSYLATVMNGYVGKIYGELHPVVNTFFYLSLTFLIFFIISFMNLIVSFTNKYFFSRL